ncbi:MAG: hypothetical protein QOI11_1447 [Candidatus Eremiobacteraeota bacterium]|jgi:hypothetical protein|nr:hypothetical protein [Candidatus Eremiobacteraeota bacterium]
MELPVQVYVNDEPRDVLSLECPRIANLHSLWLKYGRSDGGGSYGPGMCATDRDYVAGAYHLQVNEYGFRNPGSYRVRGIELRYINGATALAPVRDEIVVNVRQVEPPSEAAPVFTAR